MTDPIYQLVYCSRNAIGEMPECGLAAEVGKILESSRRNNSKKGLSGALLFTATGFAQVLEGPLDAIETTFERIQVDLRHADVTVLSLQPVERRSFAAWSMAFAGKPDHRVIRTLEDVMPGSSDLASLTKIGNDVIRLMESLIRAQDDQVPA